MFNVSIYLRKPIDGIQIHGIVYYRYNGIEYKKFPIDIWEDVCEWLEMRNGNGRMKKKNFFLLEWTIGKILNQSNLNHLCPYENEVFIRIPRIASNSILVVPQLLPAGKFRIDFSVTQRDRRRIILSGKIFFGISDHRVEIF